MGINKLKDKRSDLSHVGSGIDAINCILNHKIISLFACYSINELLDRTPIKCQLCLNRMAYGNGYDLHDCDKNRKSHNTLCINQRD